MPRVCRGGAITAAANGWTWRKTWRLNGLRKLFGCKFANVQPHSGASANVAAFMALMQPGDTFMGLNLAAGGHLTHGSPVNMSGQLVQAGALWRAAATTTASTWTRCAKLAREHRPKVIIAGGSAYPRILDFRRFREIADEVGAYLMVDMAHFAGLVAGGAHPSPFPHAHVVTSTAHKTLRGPRSGFILTNDEELAKKINSAVFPGLQGGPLMHVIAAKAVAFGEALRPSFKALRPERGGERQGAGRDAEIQGLRHRLRRHRHASHAGRSAAEEPDRQGRRSWRSAAPTSPATRTASRSTRRSRRSPRASASARRPAPRAASASPNSRRSAN